MPRPYRSKNKHITIQAANDTLINMPVPNSELKVLHLLCLHGESRAKSLMCNSSGDLSLGVEVYKYLNQLEAKGLVLSRTQTVPINARDSIDCKVYSINPIIGGIDKNLNQVMPDTQNVAPKYRYAIAK